MLARKSTAMSMQGLWMAGARLAETVLRGLRMAATSMDLVSGLAAQSDNQKVGLPAGLALLSGRSSG